MAGKKWEEQEISIIRESYELCGPKRLKELLPYRTYKSIECMANRLGLSKPDRAWSESELLLLKERYPVSTPREIQALLPQRTNQTITHMANKLGILREDYRWSDEEDAVLRKCYNNMVVKEIMKLLPNRTSDGIKLRARKLGLWQDASLPYRKCSYDYNFFSTPNITNSYYAGLVASDGSVSDKTNTLRISLKSDDAVILEQFRKDIKWTGALKDFLDFPGANSVIKNKNTATPTTLLCLSGAGQIMVDLETHYNIVPNKTLSLKPPTNLSLVNSYAFIIGLIDGDGSVHLNKHTPSKWGAECSLSISIAGTFEMMFWVKRLFDVIFSNEKRQNAEVTKQKGSNVWLYRVGGNRTYKILKELQKVPTPTCLARKWDKITEYEKLVGIVT
jgi:hypothetical protein